MLQRFAVELTPETDGRVDPTLTLRSKHGSVFEVPVSPPEAGHG